MDRLLSAVGLARAVTFQRFGAWRAGMGYGLGLLLAVPGAVAANGSLASVSPFAGEANGGTGPANAPGQLELRGVMTTPKGTLFAIHDPAKLSASTWVGLHESGPDFVVREYRIVEGEDRVKVDYQGRQLVLTLKKVQIAADTQRRPGWASGPRPAGLDPLPNQRLAGLPTADLLPGEKAKLDMFTRQVRGRLKREKAAVAANTPSAQSTAGK